MLCLFQIKRRPLASLLAETLSLWCVPSHRSLDGSALPPPNRYTRRSLRRIAVAATLAVLALGSPRQSEGQEAATPVKAATLPLFQISSVLRVPPLWMVAEPALAGWAPPPQAPAQGDGPHRSMDDDRTGSAFVPMDSWLYPALERLGSMGLIPSQSVSIRPWTRQECRRQLREAEDILFGFGSLDYKTDAHDRSEAERLLPEMERELTEPDGAATVVLDSVYARAGTIAGPALTDSFHYGQTWWNDYGRPLGRGTSAIAGYSLRAVAGRFFLYDRQEMQTDPGLPATSQAQANLFNQLDNSLFQLPGAATPAGALILPQPAVSAYVRQRPLELYGGVAFAGASLSFGKQEIFWGPTTMGPMSFSINAEPTYNLRLVSTRPHPFPLAPSLGSYRFDVVFGKLSGHQHPARPYFNGQKIELTFGPYFETSFTRWSILWGVGHPMTLHSLKDNFISSNSTGSNFQYGDRSDPGDRKSAFDFRLHVPGLTRYLTIYADAYADDELNPIDAPRRVAWNPGVYLARLPYAPHADLRFEVTSTEEMSQDEGGTRFFINNQYRDGNINKGFLLGNATGRDARAYEGRLGYWFSARTRVEGGLRQSHGGNFLPGSSSISDAFGNASWGFRPQWRAELFLQHERFLIPSYLAGSQNNTSARFQITWTPHLEAHIP
jgi:hypothetical protein